MLSTAGGGVLVGFKKPIGHISFKISHLSFARWSSGHWLAQWLFTFVATRSLPFPSGALARGGVRIKDRLLAKSVKNHWASQWPEEHRAMIK